MTGQSTTETRKMVSASTLIGPFEFYRALATRPLLTCDRAVNFMDFMELLFLLRFGTFPVEEKTICGVRSGRRWMKLPAFLLFQHTQPKLASLQHRYQVSRFWRETHAFRPNLTQPRHSDKISLFFFKYYNSRKIF